MGLKIQSKTGQETQHSVYDQHLKSSPVTGTTHVEIKAKGEQDYSTTLDEQEVVNKGVILPASEMCTVMFEGGRTINLGKFNSARISCSITVPCAKADLDETYEFATEWVSKKIEAATEGMGE
jgi:hypothetical protein